MAFTARFYTVIKRENSTLQPSGGTDFSINLKAGCDVLSPTIELQLGQSDNPTAYNYCYIPAFNRYYFIRWKWENRLWTAYGDVDPLASWKTPIGNYKGYVVRAASSYDGKIVDMLYPAKADITETKTTAEHEFTNDLSSGIYVIGVQGKSSGQNGGAVTYYAVKAGAIKSLTDYLLDVQNVYPTATDISDELLKCIFNPLQYISSCMWFPFSMVISNDSIDAGWWTVTTPSNTCKKLTDLKYTRNITYSVPKHPQAATRGAYLNLAPFSKYVINAGPWGVIPVNDQHLIDENTLACQITIDLATGSGRLSIVGKSTLCYIEDHVCQVGVPIQLGQNMFNQGAITNTIGDISSMISGMASGKITGALNALSAGYSAIGNAASLSQSVPTSVGSNGSFAFSTLFNMVGRFLTVVDDDIASRGRPLCKAVKLNTLSGYIMCEDADPAIPCTDVELKKIVSYLNGGFYYE